MSPKKQFQKDIERLKAKSSSPLKVDKSLSSKSEEDIYKTSSGTIYKVNSPNESFKQTKTKQSPIDVSNYRKNNQFVKKLSLAIFSALIIGTMSGLIILNLITPSESTSSDNNIPQVIYDEDNDAAGAPNEDLLINYEFPALSAYTLQLGVFSDAMNAEQFVQSLNKYSLPTVIWPNEDLQYVFTGIAVEKETIREEAETSIDESVEWFVKEWTNEPFQQSISSDEKEWIESFIQQWKQSVNEPQALNHEQEQWEELLNNFPESSDILIPLADQIKNFTNNQLDNQVKIDEFLILTWLVYTKIEK